MTAGYVRCLDCEAVTMATKHGECSLCGSGSVLRQQGGSLWPWLVKVRAPRRASRYAWLRA